MAREFDCCFCHKHFVGFGNDPWPAFMGDDSYCCDDCNMEIVIPARIKDMEEHNRRRMNDDKGAI